MRCSRCDQPVVPQALGQTPEGKVVFGWCLNCMEDQGCVEIEVARPSRRVSTKLKIRDRKRRRRWFMPNPSARQTVAEIQSASSRQIFRGLAAIMILWGVIVLGSGLLLTTRHSEVGFNPVEQSIPHLMIAGGGATSLVGISIGLISIESLKRTRSVLRGIQAVFFAGAISTLAFGVITHDPRRDPWIVAAATMALGVSVAARWVEIQSPRFALVKTQGGSETSKTKAW